MTIFPDLEQQLRELAAGDRTDYTHAPQPATSRMRGWWRVPSRVVAVGLPVLVAVAVAAVFALGLAGHDRNPIATRHLVPVPRAPNPAWLRPIARHFSVLNTPPMPPSAAVAKLFRETDSGLSRADFDQARRVVTPAGTFWILPSVKRICIALVESASTQSPAGTSCTTTASTERNGTDLRIGGLVDPHRAPGVNNPLLVAIAGLVPDGTVKVLVYRTSGPVITAPVHNNVFAARTAPRITSTRHIKHRPAS
jgi:hypothetical protein